MYKPPKDFEGSRLVGYFLEQVCFGLHQIQLRFDQSLMIAVTSSFLYRESVASQPSEVTIPDLPVVQSKLLQLLHHTIVKALGDEEGTLTLEFDNGHVLHGIDNSTCYESYEIILGDRHIIV